VRLLLVVVPLLRLVVLLVLLQRKHALTNLL
jgi:hypothetical protein